VTPPPRLPCTVDFRVVCDFCLSADLCIVESSHEIKLCGVWGVGITSRCVLSCVEGVRRETHTVTVPILSAPHHPSPEIRRRIAKEPEMLVMQRRSAAQEHRVRNRQVTPHAVSEADAALSSAAEKWSPATLVDEVRAGSPRFRKFSESQPGWVGISVSLYEPPEHDRGSSVKVMEPQTALDGGDHAGHAPHVRSLVVGGQPVDLFETETICQKITVLDGTWDQTNLALQFVRDTSGPWGNAMALIQRCERLCQEWAIPEAHFSPPKLLRLAKLCSLGRDPHDDEVFDLATPNDSLAEYFHKPGRVFHGIGGAGRAVLAIQTCYRQLRARWLISGALPLPLPLLVDAPPSPILSRTNTRANLPPPFSSSHLLGTTGLCRFATASVG
jgi:hypothetical protein